MPAVTRRSPAVMKATTTRTTERGSAAASRFATPMAGRIRGLLRLAAWGMLWAPMLSACAPPPGNPPLARPAPARPLHRGPLSDFISSAGLRWLLLLKPRQILSEPELGQAILQIIPSPRLDAF